MTIDEFRVTKIETCDLPDEIVTGGRIEIENGKLILHVEKTKIHWDKIKFVERIETNDGKTIAHCRTYTAMPAVLPVG